MFEFGLDEIFVKFKACFKLLEFRYRLNYFGMKYSPTIKVQCEASFESL